MRNIVVDTSTSSFTGLGRQLGAAADAGALLDSFACSHRGDQAHVVEHPGEAGGDLAHRLHRGVDPACTSSRSSRSAASRAGRFASQVTSISAR